MKNKKIFIAAKTLNNLLSEDTKQILHQLDIHTRSFHQLQNKTTISPEKLQTQLNKLMKGKLVKKNQQKQTSYYSLTFKGSSLLHPENSRIIVLISVSLFALFLFVGSLIQWIHQSIPTQSVPNHYTLERDAMEKAPQFLSTEPVQQTNDPLFSSIALIAMILFIILISFTYWRYKKNKNQAL